MKSALVMALTFVLAAGPWLCCCTAGHITRSEPTPTPATTPHKASCCGSVSEPSPAKAPTDPPLIPTRSCSCQAEIQPATLSVLTNPSLEMPLIGLLPMDCQGSTCELAVSACLANESPPGSFLDSDDLLRVFHILRC